MISDSDTGSIYDSDHIDSDVEHDLYSKLHHDVSLSINSSPALNTDLFLSPFKFNNSIESNTSKLDLPEARMNKSDTDIFSSFDSIQVDVVDLPATSGMAKVLPSVFSDDLDNVKERKEISLRPKSKMKIPSPKVKHSKQLKSAVTFSSSDNDSPNKSLSDISSVSKKRKSRNSNDDTSNFLNKKFNRKSTSSTTAKIQISPKPKPSIIWYEITHDDNAKKQAANLRNVNDPLLSSKRKSDNSFSEKTYSGHSTPSSGVLTLSSDSEFEDFQPITNKRKRRDSIDKCSNSNKQDNSESSEKIVSEDAIVISSDSDNDSVVISSDSHNDSIVMLSSDDDSVILTEPDTPNFKLNVTDVNLISDSSDDDLGSQVEKRPPISQASNRSSIKSSEDFWKINVEDSVRNRFSKALRFCQNRSPIQRSTYNQKKKCFICGGVHLSTYCSNRVCYKCWNFGHNPKGCDYSIKTCSRCNTLGHTFSDCTDNWRKYHLTIDPCNIVESKQPAQGPKMYCCSCGRNGHFAQKCTRKTGGITTVPIVSTYSSLDPKSSNFSFLKGLQERYSNIISNDFKFVVSNSPKSGKRKRPQNAGAVTTFSDDPTFFNLDSKSDSSHLKRLQEKHSNVISVSSNPTKEKKKKKALLKDASKADECNTQFKKNLEENAKQKTKRKTKVTKEKKILQKDASETAECGSQFEKKLKKMLKRQRRKLERLTQNRFIDTCQLNKSF